MKSDRSILQLGLIFLFGGFTCSSLLSQFSPKALILPLILTIFIFLFRKTNSIQLVCNLIIACQLAFVTTHIFSNLTVFWFSISVLLTFVLLCLITVAVSNRKVTDSITNSLLAAGAASVLIMSIQDHFLFDYIILSYPCVTAFIYVILSSKTTYGINILASNIVITLLISYFLMANLSIKLEFAVIAISWSSILFISFISNSNSNLGFKLYYRRFQKKRRRIKSDIFTLKSKLENANKLSSDELFSVILPLKNIKMEYKLTSLMSGNISRFNLHTKVNDMKTSAWFLVFLAYMVVGIAILYMANLAINDHLIILLSATIAYLILAPYVIMYFLKNRMVQHINSAIINPFNHLIAERNELIMSIEQILLDRGFSKRRLEECEDLSLERNEITENQHETLNNVKLLEIEI
ncbi:hypothetical protein SAMN05518871_10197 [Psychrobacillus sp. OK028]|uniref:hypothetical protein n=1 Tax=Psychrobacillus sp. OK028 TaxID=1884359 RepID=UPI0008926E2B|nr:hypothetical protein [Psychrobacillus sp. OK028]SDM38784.1 hypothetical protein SAMN05518871_10197 [Psychrobacillus sp. OK028]